MSNGLDVKSKNPLFPNHIGKIFFVVLKILGKKLQIFPVLKRSSTSLKLKSPKKKRLDLLTEVEKIVAEKLNKDETLFLVKWKGFKSE